MRKQNREGGSAWQCYYCSAHHQTTRLPPLANRLLPVGKKRCVIDLTVKCEIEHDRQADKGEKEQQNKRRIGFSFLCICLKVSLLVKQIACKTRANQTVIVDV